MWFWLTIAAAVLGAIDVMLNKKLVHKVSPALLSWALFTLTIPLLLPIAIWQGRPSLNLIFLIGVLGSSVFFVFARTIFNGALKENLVSQILPLTAFSGLFTYLFGLLILSEALRPIPIIGLFTIILGSYILNVNEAKEDVLKPFKLLFSTKGALLLLLSILLGSITAVFDKMSLKNTFPENPIFVVLSEQIIQASLISAYLIKKEKLAWIQPLKKNFGLLFLNSLTFLGVSALLFFAYIDGPVALVLGIKRLQIFFILIMGYFLLKDKPTKQSWIATAVMVVGVFMIKMG